ncbi:MAG: beta-ketoacyl-[acyl-carrier-protein] synthase family protein [Candidatus Omnitrophota bacterium]
MRDNERVVVTGIGVISSIGIGKDAFWKAALAGTSGISKVTLFDTSSFKRNYGGEVKNFESNKFIEKRKLKFLSRTSQLAIAAATLALEDSGLSLKSASAVASGVIIGTTMGERALEDALNAWIEERLDKLDKGIILQSASNSISANVGIFLKAHGTNILIPTACAAGNYSIGYGFDLLRKGEIERAIVGGADAFSKIAFAGFQRLYAMAPEKCQPFDKNRKGMLLGEGAGILILEKLDAALKRNATIYAEICGYGLSCDAHHMTAPKPEGIAKAMSKAIKESKIEDKEVSYICAHGTGTPSNDKAECVAIKSVLKDNYRKVPVSSLKSMLGHTMGAASAIEAAACCLAVKNDSIPPTINFETADPECDIDSVANKSRKARVNIALNNAFAFGGNNSCVVFKKYS